MWGLREGTVRRDAQVLFRLLYNCLMGVFRSAQHVIKCLKIRTKWNEMEMATSASTMALMLMPTTSCYTCTRILQFSHFPHFPFAMGNTCRGGARRGRPLMSSKIISKSILQQMRQHVERSLRRGEGEWPIQHLQHLQRRRWRGELGGGRLAALRLTFINCKAKKMEKPTKENA